MEGLREAARSFCLKNVAIIPARGGSKGIPNKNILNVGGKPLIAWSIEHSLKANCIDSVWVTSDSDEILSIAQEFGANPIKRPDTLSTDTASSESAWIHAIDYIEEKTKSPIQLVFGLQPTSPLREPVDFDNSLELFLQESYDSLFSSVEIQDMFIWEKEGDTFTGVNHDYKNRKRRQLIKPRFVENGSFYIFSPEGIKENGNRLYGKVGTYPMDAWKRFQIDTPDELKLCDAIIKGMGLC